MVSDEAVSGMSAEERGVVYYTIGFWKNEAEPFHERYVQACAADNVLQLKPIAVYTASTQTVEIALVSREGMNETEWNAWFEVTMQTEWSKRIAIQTRMMVTSNDGEACMDRIIEKCVLEKCKLQQDGRILMEHHVFDAYRIASGGRMHFFDTREWPMPMEKFDEMRAERLRLEWDLQEAWQRRVRLNQEIEMARDIWDLYEKLSSFEPVGDHYHMVENRGIQWQFKVQFDWHDIQILEDKETEMLVHMEGVSNQIARLNAVLDRQRAILGIPEKGTRKGAQKRRREMRSGEEVRK